VKNRLGVLVSGRGSNLQALLDSVRTGQLDATIAVVISNRPGAAAMERAREAGIEALCIDHREFGSRDGHDRAVAQELRARDVGLVCLAGYMRLVGQPILDVFPNAVLNIHPSLLPAFPGANAQRQAVEHGVKVSGVTVHLVTAELDGGPIVVQRAVPVLDTDTADTLSARILAEEHRAYPEAVRLILEGGWRVEGRRFIRSAGALSG
jgi:phosphoribosylglycinamide formyltransferase-1